MAKWNRQNASQAQNRINESANAANLKTNIPASWETALIVDIKMNYGEDILGNNPEIGLGWVKFRRLETDRGTPESNLEWAMPLNNMTTYPVKGEMVLVSKGPSAPSDYYHDGDVKMCAFYYIGPFNYKNAVNENAISQVLETDINLSSGNPADNYVRESNSDPTSEQADFVLNKYGYSFVRASSIYPLQPLEGDTIINGRYGNSIRFSTSQPNPSGYQELDETKGYLDNPWSDNENNVGEDPILIIRNGQSDESRDVIHTSPEALLPMFENLKDDKSSIWLTDGQTINSLSELLNDATEDGSGVMTTSQIKANGLGNVYTDFGKATPQVIITSDRIIFAAKDDEILLFGKNGIGLAADNDIVIESNDTITISAPVIELAGEVKYGVGGGKAINGEKLVELLEDLCDEIMGLSVITATGPGTANPSPSIQSIKDKLADALSSGEDQA